MLCCCIVNMLFSEQLKWKLLKTNRLLKKKNNSFDWSESMQKDWNTTVGNGAVSFIFFHISIINNYWCSNFCAGTWTAVDDFLPHHWDVFYFKATLSKDIPCFQFVIYLLIWLNFNFVVMNHLINDNYNWKVNRILLK